MSKSFHGDSRRNNKFWVYPKNMKVAAPWDTNDLHTYCNNYKYCHTYLNNGVAEYKCLGHDITEHILIAILCKDKAACLPLYLECIYNLNYPKKKLHLYIRTNDNNDNSNQLLLDFICKYGEEYGSVYFDNSSISPKLKKMAHRDWNSYRFQIIGQVRQDSIDYAIKYKLHYFVADCDNFVTSNTLIELFKRNKCKVIGPMLPTKTGYSNYHYAVDNDGYYRHHENYMKVLRKQILGPHPVAVIHCTYFIRNDTLKDIKYIDGTGRHEYVIFSDTLRKKNITQYILNNDFYGFLTWHTEEEKLKDDLRGWFKWALPRLKLPENYLN